MQNKEIDERLKVYRQTRLAIESILRESLKEKNERITDLMDLLENRNRRIRELQDQIRALREALPSNWLDPRFWIGFPVDLWEVQWTPRAPDRRKKHR